MSRKPSPVQRRGKREQERLFQIGDFWLGYEADSDVIFYYWYDAKTRRTRRKTTGLRDLEKAKTWLAARVLAQPPDDPLHPDLVTIASVRHFYWNQHAKQIRSANTAKRAMQLVTLYMKQFTEEGAPKVGHFGLAKQVGFMKWCRDAHGLSAKSISTYLSYYKSALNFAATPRLLKDFRGHEREVRLLSFAPHVVDSEARVSEETKLARSKPRHWIPEDEQLAAIIDEIRDEHGFRYVIMALNTWARPEAIVELNVSKQVDFDRGLVDLNPPGRMQNKKLRPTIRLTDNLRGWLLHWNLERPIERNGKPVARVDNRTLAKAARRAGVTEPFTKYTLRHYMATRIKRVSGIPVSREERAEWIGHVDQNHRTLETWYESLDPDHLINVARATDAIIELLDKLTVKSLSSPRQRPNENVIVLKSVEN